MANQIYANGLEVSCKAAEGKSICAFPDVCFTPPQTPATPPGVPIPYPNTGMASDCTDGSSTVQISGKEVMLKNKSYFKKSMGDEAGCAPKKGVVTSKNAGKVYFNSWSMDVKVEGENVVRTSDLTTHNHGSAPGNSPTWPYLDKSAVDAGTGPCKTEMANEKTACQGCKPYGDGDPCASKACQDARKCMLAPFAANKTDYPNVHRCCDGLTPHHIVPLGEFCLPRSQSGGQRGQAPLNDSVKGYNGDLAPCICVEGSDHKRDKASGQLKEHGQVGSAYIRERQARGIENKQQNVKYSDLRDCGAASVKKVFGHCSEDCTKEQLDNYHVKTAKIPPDDPVCQASQQSDYGPKPTSVPTV
ncbi:PAAR-like domain-containing protein [Piscinibacterium candidicorallinum]|uniref:PAAR-like domain-containing protein n=1 Tax=Piscinibacterium candidicorallinum TaxID=1793872 RepID=A0ABV7H6L0_9BURK